MDDKKKHTTALTQIFQGGMSNRAKPTFTTFLMLPAILVWANNLAKSIQYSENNYK